MIDGVKIKKLIKHIDQRGYFMEILRNDDNLLSVIGQVSISETKPGIIKAFHMHKNQDDVWFLYKGKIIAVLYDKRENSPTYKQKQKLYLGDEPILFLVPRGVVHGYKIIGDQTAIMIYIMNIGYNAKTPDEIRIPQDTTEINFDWEKEIFLDKPDS